MTNGIGNVSRLVPGLIEQSAGSLNTIAKPEPKTDVDFGEMFSNMLNSVNDLQVESGSAQKALMSGEPIELHEVMIKAQEAGVSMDLLLEIRNRLLSAYNEIMRMPM